MVRQGSREQRCLEPPFTKTLEMPKPPKNRQPNDGTGLWLRLL